MFCTCAWNIRVKGIIEIFTNIDEDGKAFKVKGNKARSVMSFHTGFQIFHDFYFFLERCLKNQRLGQKFYWMLRCEVFAGPSALKFPLVLEVMK